MPSERKSADDDQDHSKVAKATTGAETPILQGFFANRWASSLPLRATRVHLVCPTLAPLVSGADEHSFGEGPCVEPFLDGSAEQVCAGGGDAELLRSGVTRQPPLSTARTPPGGRWGRLH